MRKQKLNWIKNFKIAIIEENANEIESLIDTMPVFSNNIRAKEALALIEEALKVVRKKRTQTLKNMNKIKQTKKFLSS